MPNTIKIIDYKAENADKDFVDSLHNTGFAILYNHPLEINMINSVYEEWGEFFNNEEKYTYTLIGFIIIAIAGFTLMSMMSLSVMQKVPQIGILRAIGMQSHFIRYIFIKYNFSSIVK